jgi:hypothetical protein
MTPQGKKAELKLDEDVVSQLGEKLYSQPMSWVLIRELIQNALDAGATRIDVDTDFQDNLTVTDNGSGMEYETMINTFLTLGGSEKDRGKTIVGGFGIAKLAIFSCDDFCVSSKGLRLTKAILSAHKRLQKYQDTGNTAVAVTKQGFLSGNDKELRWFLRCIDRDGVEIFLNGDRVARININESEFGILNVEYYTTSYYPMTLVRSNGLPLFTRSTSQYFPDDIKNICFLFDVNTDLTPYDTDYPFTVTRDGFSKSGPFMSDHSKMISTINRYYDGLKNDRKKKRENRRFNDQLGSWEAYNPEVNKTVVDHFVKFKKLFDLLMELDKYEGKPIEFEIIGESDEAEEVRLSEDQEQQIVSVPHDVETDEKLLGLAIHLYCHVSESENHYDGFANKITEMIEKVFKFYRSFENILKGE